MHANKLMVVTNPSICRVYTNLMHANKLLVVTNPSICRVYTNLRRTSALAVLDLVRLRRHRFDKLDYPGGRRCLIDLVGVMLAKDPNLLCAGALEGFTYQPYSLIGLIPRGPKLFPFHRTKVSTVLKNLQ